MKPQQEPRKWTDQRKRQRQRNMDWNIGTWNVLSWYRPGAAQLAVEVLEKYKMDITAVQEIRWLNSGNTKISKSVILYSGKEDTHEFGTGFVIKEGLMSELISFKPINERICSIRLRGKWYNISLIAVHAPTEEAEEGTKDAFYERLEQTVNEIPKEDMMLVLGDYNAKVGREETSQLQFGKHSLHASSNDNGNRLVDFAVSNNLLIKSTMFPHKDIHKQTWISNDGITRNQIDHVLIDSRHGSNIIDVRSCRGADGDTDHILIKAKTRLRLAARKEKSQKKEVQWNIEKLKQQEVKDRYQQKIEQECGEINMQNLQVEEMWKTIKETIREASKEILGEKQNTKKKLWFDTECQDLNGEKYGARTKMLQNPSEENRNKFHNLRNRMRKLTRKKKREWQNEQLQELETNRAHGNIRKFYKQVSTHKKGFRPRTTTMLMNNEGELMTSKQEILDTWREYFNKLLNIEDPTYQEEDKRHMAEVWVDPPSIEETTQAIKQLKNNKAAGRDGIPAECLKEGGHRIVETIHKLIQKIWEQESMPDEWKEGVIIPIHKKGNRLACNNYRGITLLNTSYKVLSNIIKKRITPYSEEIVGEYQSGFRRKRSTTDQLFTLRQLLEKCWEFNRDLHNLFVDFKQAYDSIIRASLWTALEELGIPGKLIRMIKVCVEGSYSSIKIEGHYSETFEITTGLKQGDALSPALFNIALEKVVRRTELTTNIFGHNGPCLILAYADDLDVVGRSTVNVKEAFIKLEKEAKKMGLKVNEEKTKYMHMTRNVGRDRIRQNVTMDEYNFEHVQTFQYLGALITSDNNVKVEIKQRILQGNKCYYATQQLLRSRTLTRQTKINIYKTIIRPVVTYGSETWTMTVQDTLLLNRFERKILRKIYGGVWDQQTVRYRRRTNNEVYELYNSPSIVQEIKSNRLRWLGHVQRSNDSRLIKMVWEEAPNNKRPLGRPKLRWRDNIRKDLQTLGVLNWEESTQDRHEWRRIVEAAKTHPGL